MIMMCCMQISFHHQTSIPEITEIIPAIKSKEEYYFIISPLSSVEEKVDYN